MKKNLGFTVLELVLVIAIVAILGAVGSRVFSSGIQAYTATAASMDELNQMRFGLERIARELREVNFVTGAAQITTPFSNNKITFTKTDGTAVTLQQSGSLINLTYSTPAATSAIMRNVTAFTLAYKQNDGATNATTTANIGFVDITVSATVASGNYSRSTRVSLRNI